MERKKTVVGLRQMTELKLTDLDTTDRKRWRNQSHKPDSKQEDNGNRKGRKRLP